MNFTKQDKKEVFEFFEDLLLKYEPIYYDHLRGYISEASPVIQNYIRKECKGEKLLEYFKRRKNYFVTNGHEISLKKLKNKTYSSKLAKLTDSCSKHITSYGSNETLVNSSHTRSNSYVSSCKSSVKSTDENEVLSAVYSEEMIEYEKITFSYFHEYILRNDKLNLGTIEFNLLPKKVKRYLSNCMNKKLIIFFQNYPDVFNIVDNCVMLITKYNEGKISSDNEDNPVIEDIQEQYQTKSEEKAIKKYFACIKFFVDILISKRSPIHVNKLSGYLSKSKQILDYLNNHNYKPLKTFFLNASKLFYLTENDEVYLAENYNALLKQAKIHVHIKLKDRYPSTPIQEIIKSLFALPPPITEMNNAFKGTTKSNTSEDKLESFEVSSSVSDVSTTKYCIDDKEFSDKRKEKTFKYFTRCLHMIQLICLEIVDKEQVLCLKYEYSAVKFFVKILLNSINAGFKLGDLQGYQGQASSEVKMFLKLLHRGPKLKDFFLKNKEFEFSDDELKNFTWVELSDNYKKYLDDRLKAQQTFTITKTYFQNLCNAKWNEMCVDFINGLFMIFSFLQNKQKVKLSRLCGIIHKFPNSLQAFINSLGGNSQSVKLQKFLKFFRFFIFSSEEYLEFQPEIAISLIIEHFKPNVDTWFPEYFKESRLGEIDCLLNQKENFEIESISEDFDVLKASVIKCIECFLSYKSCISYSELPSILDTTAETMYNKLKPLDIILILYESGLFLIGNGQICYKTETNEDKFYCEIFSRKNYVEELSVGDSNEQVPEVAVDSNKQIPNTVVDNCKIGVNEAEFHNEIFSRKNNTKNLSIENPNEQGGEIAFDTTKQIPNTLENNCRTEVSGAEFHNETFSNENNAESLSIENSNEQGGEIASDASKQIPNILEDDCKTEVSGAEFHNESFSKENDAESLSIENSNEQGEEIASDASKQIPNILEDDCKTEVSGAEFHNDSFSKENDAKSLSIENSNEQGEEIASDASKQIPNIVENNCRTEVSGAEFHNESFSGKNNAESLSIKNSNEQGEIASDTGEQIPNILDNNCKTEVSGDEFYNETFSKKNNAERLSIDDANEHVAEIAFDSGKQILSTVKNSKYCQKEINYAEFYNEISYGKNYVERISVKDSNEQVAEIVFDSNKQIINTLASNNVSTVKNCTIEKDKLISNERDKEFKDNVILDLPKAHLGNLVKNKVMDSVENQKSSKVIHKETFIKNIDKLTEDISNLEFKNSLKQNEINPVKSNSSFSEFVRIEENIENAAGDHVQKPIHCNEAESPNVNYDSSFKNTSSKSIERNDESIFNKNLNSSFLEPLSAKVILMTIDSCIAETNLNNHIKFMYCLKSTFHCDQHTNCVNCFHWLNVGDNVLCYLPPKYDECKLGNMCFAFKFCKDSTKDTSVSKEVNYISKQYLSELQDIKYNIDNSSDSYESNEAMTLPTNCNLKHNSLQSNKCFRSYKNEITFQPLMVDEICAINHSTCTQNNLDVRKVCEVETQTELCGEVQLCSTAVTKQYEMKPSAFSQCTQTSIKYCDKDCQSELTGKVKMCCPTIDRKCQTQCSTVSQYIQTLCLSNYVECQTELSGEVKPFSAFAEKETQVFYSQSSKDTQTIKDVNENECQTDISGKIKHCVNMSSKECQTVLSEFEKKAVYLVDKSCQSFPISNLDQASQTSVMDSLTSYDNCTNHIAESNASAIECGPFISKCTTSFCDKYCQTVSTGAIMIKKFHL